MLAYFVRHGKTTLGEEGRHQYRDTPLSKRGLKEAYLTANRLKDFDFETIITSPFLRARETADIINIYHHKLIQESELFAETKRPSEIEGRYKNDPKVDEIEKIFKENQHIPDWRYSDEETFSMLKNRASLAVLFLENHSADKVLVTLHGDILRLIISIMQHGENLTPELFYRFRNFAPTHNTGITVCHLHPDRGWVNLMWNDYIHLVR